MLIMHFSCSQENTDEVATEQVVDIASNPDLDIDETVDVLDDDAIDEVVSTIDLQQLVFEIPPAVTLPPEVDVEKQLKSFMFDEPVRLNQVAHNQCIEYLLGNTVKLQEFCLTEYSVLLNIYNETIRPTKKNTVPESQLTAFYKAFQRYITSEQYKQLCLILFTSQHNADAVFSLCFK